MQSIWAAGHSPFRVSELSALLRTGRKRHGQLHHLTIDLLQYFPEVILCRVQPCRHGHVEGEHNQVHGGKEEEGEEKTHASSPHAFVLNGRKKKRRISGILWKLISCRFGKEVIKSLEMIVYRGMHVMTDSGTNLCSFGTGRRGA